jgi:hypothetical protein
MEENEIQTHNQNLGSRVNYLSRGPNAKPHDCGEVFPFPILHALVVIDGVLDCRIIFSFFKNDPLTGSLIDDHI